MQPSAALSFSRRIHNLKHVVRRSLKFARDVRGKYPRLCNICNFQGLFMYFGDPPRRDALCPRCHSLERHRLLHLWCVGHAAELTGRATLHFAAEPAITGFLKPLVGEYKSADIRPGAADLILNIEAIDIPDASVDLVVCSHVLEHVRDDMALADLRRVMRPGGIMLAMIPIVEGWAESHEDPSQTSAAARDLHFGQNDHVRYYGADFRDRIQRAGFKLEEFTAVEPMVSRHGLVRGEKVFVCRR